MNELVFYGLAVVQWVQSFRNPILDSFFAITYYLGSEDFYFLALPLLFWCLNKSLGIRLGGVLVFSNYLNVFFKDLFAAPRPYQVDSKLYAPFKTEGFGIPSGHAQGTTTFWGYLATQLKTRAWWALAIALAVYVGVGRMYVGDHFPHDVLLGWVLGIVIVAGYAWLEPRTGEWLGNQPMSVQVGLAIIVPLILAALHWTADSAKAAGILLGFFAGLPIEAKFIRFDVHGEAWKQVVKFVIGLTILLALRFGLKAILPEQPLFDLIRYAAMGAWVSVGAPWVFVKSKLAVGGRQ
jgi:membrane-associated phospholipid phosphatase